MTALDFGCHAAGLRVLPCVAAVVWLREHQEGMTEVWAEVRVVRSHSMDDKHQGQGRVLGAY